MTTITLTDAEFEELQEMIREWIGEGFTAEPYKQVVYDVLKKLQIDT